MSGEVGEGQQAARKRTSRPGPDDNCHKSSGERTGEPHGLHLTMGDDEDVGFHTKPVLVQGDCLQRAIACRTWGQGTDRRSQGKALHVPPGPGRLWFHVTQATPISMDISGFRRVPNSKFLCCGKPLLIHSKEERKRKSEEAAV